MNQHSVVFDATTKTTQDLCELYGIEINEDGTVFDPCDYTHYDTILVWAAAMDADVDPGGFTRSGGKQDYWED